MVTDGEGGEDEEAGQKTGDGPSTPPGLSVKQRRVWRRLRKDRQVQLEPLKAVNLELYKQVVILFTGLRLFYMYIRAYLYLSWCVCLWRENTASLDALELSKRTELDLS